MAILWFASFPKSGNTWVRALMANYIAGGDQPVELNTLPNFAFADSQLWAYEKAAGRPLPEAPLTELMPFKPAAHRLMADAISNLAFVKTHNALRMLHGVPTITPAVTAGAIYIVRNPLDVTLSYADHFGMSVGDAVDAMSSDSLYTKGRADRAAEYLGSWSSHVRGWTNAPGLKRHLVRYEDLHADPAGAFRAILQFLQQPVDEARLTRAVAHSSFDALARQEAADGFVERSRNQARFFRVGRSGQWRDALAPALVAKVVAAHGEVMAAHGYLDEAGDPV